jgi:hypothetical protein
VISGERENREIAKKKNYKHNNFICDALSNSDSCDDYGFSNNIGV